MKKLLLLSAIVILFASLAVACDEPELCCVRGHQFETYLIDGNMLSVTFEVKTVGAYRFHYVIKSLQGIPVKVGNSLNFVLDCWYKGKVTAYIPLKGLPLKPYTNYFIFVTMSITTSPQEVEQYYPMEEAP